MSKYGNEVDSLTLIPSGGGVYKVWKNDDLLFSKKEVGRFPHSDDEVIDKF
ncbi:MAG: Rdx family protein [Candidatus Marinimicrobia bacterium]|nr:Rdx family protein [Candidatus Neomarinimicrobiota bacterium]MCF7850236.1 Rdx family protein [Candidatus Neomarinimicrobiota bacterium]MCF7903722.1 Rdx family protein [Candidatus Neomarinimicrobiota bacterium]